MKGLVLCISLLFGPLLWAADPRCVSILNSSEGEKKVSRHELIESFLKGQDGLKMFNVLAMKEMPSWKEYKWVIDVKTAVQNDNLSANDLKDLLPQLQEAARNFEQTDLKRKFVDKYYSLFEHLQAINLHLRSEVFPNIYLKHAEKNEDLIDKALQIVRANEKRLRQLYSTTNYRDTVDIVNTIETQSDLGQSLLELINDGLMVTIRRPEGGRFWIPITGFQNQRVTGKSNGSFNPEYRNMVESLLTDIPLNAYESQSVRLMPQYGEARPDLLSSNLRFSSGADRYGSDLWVVKKDVIEKRATWTPRDSFGQPQPREYVPPWWDQMFLPWSHRELMAPFLIESFSQKSFFLDSPPESIRLTGNKFGGSYIEVQVWGPVSLQDIEAFVFTENPPENDFTQTLESYGIKIIDGRKSPAVLYEVSK